MATNVLGTVYETLLCSPGMNEMVKIDIKMSRKTVLLLNNVIEGNIGADGNTLDFLKIVPEADRQELKLFAEESLKKAGLMELNEKMKALSIKV